MTERDQTAARLLRAARDDDVEMIRQVIEGAPEPLAPTSVAQALYVCAQKGLLEGVQILTPHCPLPRLDSGMQAAARFGHVECLRHIADRVEDTKFHSYAMVAALCGKYPHCIAALLPTCDLDHVAQLCADDGLTAIDQLAPQLSLNQMAWIVDNMPSNDLPHIRARLQATEQAAALDEGTPQAKVKSSPRL